MAAGKEREDMDDSDHGGGEEPVCVIEEKGDRDKGKEGEDGLSQDAKGDGDEEEIRDEAGGGNQIEITGAEWERAYRGGD